MTKKKITLLMISAFTMILLTGCAVTSQTIKEDIQNISISDTVIETVSPCNNFNGSIYSDIDVSIKYNESLDDNSLKEYANKYIDELLKIKGRNILGKINGTVKIKSKSNKKLYPAVSFTINEDNSTNIRILRYKLTDEEKKILKLSYKEIEKLKEEEKLPFNIELALSGYERYFVPEYFDDLYLDIDRINEEKEEENIENMVKENKLKYKDIKIGEVKYKDLARNPEVYENKNLRYKGKVYQVLENEDESLSLRIALNGDYKEVIYANISAKVKRGLTGRILEDDIVEFGCFSTGIKNYTSTVNLSVSVPSVEIEYINIVE